MIHRFGERPRLCRALALLALVALLALALAPAAAAAPETGFTVALGDVVDTAGAPLAGATLTFTLVAAPVQVGHPPSPILPPGPPTRVATNGGGQFQVLLLAGTYAVTVERDGYTQVVNQDNDSVLMPPGPPTRYRFIMQASATP